MVKTWSFPYSKVVLWTIKLLHVHVCNSVFKSLIKEVFILYLVNENTVYRQSIYIFIFSGSLVSWGLAKKSYRCFSTRGAGKEYSSLV